LASVMLNSAGDVTKSAPALPSGIWRVWRDFS
jgi:hypothetical protein